MHLDKKLICLAVVIIGLSLYAGCTNVDQLVGRQLDTVIEWELNEGDKKPKGNSVLVALYLDTEDSQDTTTIAEYRCYNYGGRGYSGVNSVPFRTPWTRWEKIRSNRFKKEIVIDPGPPYKKAKRIVTLIPGEVANLGRIVLEKVEADGTASIVGTIRDENGKPLEGITVSSSKAVVTTDAEGSYRIDGLGLEVCDLKVKQEGYIPSSAKVSIRNMDKRIIRQDFVLSRKKKIRLRYVISPLEKDDFNSPKAVEGTVEFLVDKNFVPLVVEKIRDKDFNQFVDKVKLRFRVEDGKLTLQNSYAPIFYKRYRMSSEEFETISSVGALNYNSQRCPSIQEGDIILINGGKISNYTLKILFEKVQQILP
ncbi:MAG: carboxypeptidase regulatory-like domain-containing protein [Sedimentisphaerales bacterium]|nr:carboxypeptidase regulatory-like domain-containing protein [Sedimentisphaerales bacterium]